MCHNKRVATLNATPQILSKSGRGKGSQNS